MTIQSCLKKFIDAAPGGINGKQYWWYWVGCVLLIQIENGLLDLLLMIFISIVLIEVLVSRYGRQYMTGAYRAEVTTGIIKPNMKRIEYEHIRGVEPSQSIFQGLMLIGRLVVCTSSGDSELSFIGMYNSDHYRGMIKQRLRSVGDHSIG
ncbi:MAG: putative membrane protein YdbT with pleckstrin-like domain [Gammaproteobacteria bacterium]|jgi:uncharacterized membrane protein YdbT with pleckstrin-like domain